MPLTTRDPTQVHDLRHHLGKALALDRPRLAQVKSLAAQLNDRPVMPVLGAGASCDCGMRVASQISKDLYAVYCADPDSNPLPDPKDFGSDLGAVADAIWMLRGQRGLVKSAGLGRRNLWPDRADMIGHFCSYRVLARLAREEMLTEALTFNYDCGFEAGLQDEGFAFTRTTTPGRSWDDHVTVISDATTNAVLKRRGSFVLVKAHGCAARYRELKRSKRAADTMILRRSQLLDWRKDHWARDLFRERARRHILLLIGFSGEDPITHIALTRALEDVYEQATTDGQPRVVVLGHQPDTVALRLLRRVGRGGDSAASPGAIDQLNTGRGTTTTAVLTVLLAEILHARLAPLLSAQDADPGGELEARLAAYIVSAPAMLRWSYLLRRPDRDRDFMQRTNLEYAAKEGYVPLTANPHTTASAMRVRRALRSKLGLRDDESIDEASDDHGWIVPPAGAIAYMPTGRPIRDLTAAARGRQLETARTTLLAPTGLERVLVADDTGEDQGVSLDTGAMVDVP